MNLRPVARSDAPFLYILLMERPSYANINHRASPSYADHLRFLESNPYDAWYIVEDAGEPVGSVHLTSADEIGVGIIAEARGRGLGTAAILELMERNPRPRFQAFISPLNPGSQRLFERLGFGLTQLTYSLRAST